MDKNAKQEMIDALSAMRSAFNRVNKAWTEEMVDQQMGTDNYPFEFSFDELTHAMSDWVESFQAELTPQHRYWIDTRNDQGEYLWFYKETNGTVFNVLGASVRDEGTQDLTEISKQQYQAIESLWYGFNIDEDSPADHPNRDKSIQFEQDILDIIANPNASIAEIHQMRAYYGNDNV